jgi:hypothetical protein
MAYWIVAWKTPFLAEISAWNWRQICLFFLIKRELETVGESPSPAVSFCETKFHSAVRKSIDSKKFFP